MAILKRIVPEYPVKDYRNSKGVHYEAQCSHCNRIYYPKRSTSKYCSKECGTFAFKGVMGYLTAEQQDIWQETQQMMQELDVKIVEFKEKHRMDAAKEELSTGKKK